MRIDVQLPPLALEAELERIHARMQRTAGALSRLRTLDIRVTGLAFRHREADGEHYVYAQDLASGRLAGYTVFNRLIELDRRADPHLRAPHSRYARAWQRRGIASAVYRWALAGGMNLVTGARQSEGAHALWRKLARSHELGYVELKDKVLLHLGDSIDAQSLEDFHTRMVLLGRGWDLERFLRETGARSACAEAADAP
ncbi:MAG: N-acetyltransferase [Comamonadaceae bacterium]|nr:MAG: N-acetyltransferase [Comamonadaceae bacterium]